MCSMYIWTDVPLDRGNVSDRMPLGSSLTRADPHVAIRSLHKCQMLFDVLAQEVCIVVNSQPVIEDTMANRAERILDIIEPHHRGKTPGVISFHENALRCNGLFPPSTFHCPKSKVRSTFIVLSGRMQMPIEPFGDGTESIHSSHIATDHGLVEMGRSLLVDIETLTGIHQGRNTPVKLNHGEHLNDPTRIEASVGHSYLLLWPSPKGSLGMTLSGSRMNLHNSAGTSHLGTPFLS